VARKGGGRACSGRQGACAGLAGVAVWQQYRSLLAGLGSVGNNITCVPTASLSTTPDHPTPTLTTPNPHPSPHPPQPYPLDQLEVITDLLPADRWHGERYMRFSPADGLLYVSIGAPCDVCLERKSPQGIVHASIYTLNVTSGALKLYSTGAQ